MGDKQTNDWLRGAMQGPDDLPRGDINTGGINAKYRTYHETMTRAALGRLSPENAEKAIRAMQEAEREVAEEAKRGLL